MTEALLVARDHVQTRDPERKHEPQIVGGRIHVVTIVGTRPEAIKMAPVVRELVRRSDRFDCTLVATSQHRQLLDMTLADLGLRTDYDLDLMRPGQRLADFAALALVAVTETLQTLCPHMLLVQGDTTSVAAGALAAFYRRVPVGHIEAGLRSFDRTQPFPEETNRRIAALVADLHFAPTEVARRNLLAEGVDDASIAVTGNTVVDALRMMRRDATPTDSRVAEIVRQPGTLLLVTTHRRENHGAPLRELCSALKEIAHTHPEVRMALPVHPNPSVRAVVREILGGEPNIHLIDPVTHSDFHHLLQRCYFVLSDSGGVQEEAATLGKPILILRDVTERPEVVTSGVGRLVGTSRVRIVEEAERLLNDREAYGSMRHSENPFGDGHAAERIVERIEAWVDARRERRRTPRPLLATA
jgi:UDP-N-acetylglucosamine 2-epimerase (non-hydrolysing)